VSLQVYFSGLVYELAIQIAITGRVFYVKFVGRVNRSNLEVEFKD